MRRTYCTTIVPESVFAFDADGHPAADAVQWYVPGVLNFRSDDSPLVNVETFPVDPPSDDGTSASVAAAGSSKVYDTVNRLLSLP